MVLVGLVAPGEALSLSLALIPDVSVDSVPPTLAPLMPSSCLGIIRDYDSDHLQGLLLVTPGSLSVCVCSGARFPFSTHFSPMASVTLGYQGSEETCHFF